MGRPHQTNNKGSIVALCLLTVAILTLPLELITPLGVYCNDHLAIMTVIKQSDTTAAAASIAKPIAKASRSTKQHLQTSQQILHL
jgi:hypothetical protein